MAKSLEIIDGWKCLIWTLSSIPLMTLNALNYFLFQQKETKFILGKQSIKLAIWGRG